MHNKSDFKIIRIDKTKIDSIKPLWEKLKNMHTDISPYFNERFKKMNWESRKSDLFKKSKKIYIEYVVSKKSNHIIGYCISTISKENNKVGEIDSIFVERKYRNYGLGKQLIKNSIKWLNNQKIETQRLAVGVGNEYVIDFYKQLSFFPLHIVLQRKNIIQN